MRLVVLISIAFLIVSCSQHQTPVKNALLEAQYQADPKYDAAQAITQQDYRFIAVHNHELKMPMNIDTCLLDKFGYRVISNETLDYMSFDYQMYGVMSQIYANWYNYEILIKLEELEEFPCQ